MYDYSTIIISVSVSNITSYATTQLSFFFKLALLVNNYCDGFWQNNKNILACKHRPLTTY